MALLASKFTPSNLKSNVLSTQPSYLLHGSRKKFPSPNKSASVSAVDFDEYALLVWPLLSTVSSPYLQNCPSSTCHNFHSFLSYFPTPIILSYHLLAHSLTLSGFSHSSALPLPPPAPSFSGCLLPHLQDETLFLLPLYTSFLPPVNNC